MAQQNIPGTTANNEQFDSGPLAGGNSADQQARIRDRALELASARGQAEGYSEEDWRLAEEEIPHISGGG
jgi:hypothetical protein